MPGRRNASGLRRDLGLLEVLADGAGGRVLGVSAISGLVGREKSQVSRALASLAEEGLVERDTDSQGYRLGWRLYALAARTHESRLVTLAGPVLRGVVARVQETTVLCVLRGGDVLTVASEAPAHAFRAVGWEGVTVPAASTSAGRVLVSEWPPEAVGSLLSSAGPVSEGARPASEPQLLAELAKIRERGYASVDEEFEAGVVGCSAAVRDFNGRIVAAVNITAPKARLGDRLDAAGSVVATAAEQLTNRLVAATPR